MLLHILSLLPLLPAVLSASQPAPLLSAVLSASQPAPSPPPPAPLPPAPQVPLPVPNSKCGLPWLELNLSPQGRIACRGSDLQKFSAGRYWGTQQGKDADVVVFPANAQDVAESLKIVSYKAPKNLDFSFVSGGHSCINGSSATGLVIDLSWLNDTQVLPNFQLPDGGGKADVVTYQPGATVQSVNMATAGSGSVAIMARINSVGAGGFSTGGGIGFLGGAYGYAIDRIIQMEVALASGTIVLASKKNEYLDLFWALQGGNGQLGIVTRFWVKAVPEPTGAEIGLYWIKEEEKDLLRANIVKFFGTNKDPHSLLYWVRGYTSDSLSGTDLGMHEILVTLRFGDPNNPSQPPYDDIFASVLEGLTPASESVLSVPYEMASDVTTAFFPEGFRRLFNGPQVTSIDVKYLNDIASRVDTELNAQLSVGDTPASAIFVLQYQNPGLGGNAPKSDSDTAWPHATSSGGHQTLWSPAWSNAVNDLLPQNAAGDLNSITYARQAQTGVTIADYPNYIAARGTKGATKNGGWDGGRYFRGNWPRLLTIKAKYDPDCIYRKGAVWATASCVQKGFATMF